MIYGLGWTAAIGRLILAVVLSLEFTLIILLIWKPDLGIMGSVILLGVFSGIVLTLYIMGVQKNCGCFGRLVRDQIGPVKIGQNLGLMLLLIASWFLRKEDV